MRGLACDARKDTVWMFSDKFVFEIEIVEEDRDVWRLYLAEGKFANALEYCDNDQQVGAAQSVHMRAARTLRTLAPQFRCFWLSVIVAVVCSARRC